jgi:hypothetical protein
MWKILAWPYRRIKLEALVNSYIISCGGNLTDKEARRQARELIAAGPDNPMMA